MKKTIILILSMLLVLSLAACGGQSTEPVGKADTDTAQTEQVEQTEQQPETETVDEPEQSDSSAFDNSWASNDFEMQLPEPPFEEWRITEQTESLWRLESIKAHYDETLTYADALRNAGFSANENEQDFDKLGYIFEADNAAGYHIDLTYEGNDQGNGRVALELTKNTSFDASQNFFDTSWANNEFEQLIPQPPFEDWYGQVSEKNENFYMMSTPETGENYKEEFQAYIQLLKDYGFDVEYDDEYDTYDVLDSHGNYITLGCDEDGVAFIDIEKVSD